MTFLLIVTNAALLLAAIMSVVAWRLAGDERRRSEARIAALAAEIHAADEDVRWNQESTAHEPPELTYNSPHAPAHGTLFTPHEQRSGRTPLAGFAVGVLAVAAVGATAIVLPGIRMRATRVQPGAAPIPSMLPLELVALGHERDGDQLTVRGVVRNPSTGSEIDQLTAVVFVVASDGEYRASARSAVESPALQPGGETTFAVTVPRAGDVSRYRVSFRTGDRLVPHLDRRHEG